MRASIDSAGRLVIPKEIRRQAGIRPGMELEIRWADGHIEIEPRLHPVRLVQHGPLLVAVRDGDAEPLTNEMVQEIRESLWPRP